jgi:hypothetical protein
MSMTNLDATIDGGKVGYLDLAGAVTSGLCTLHCALMPALVAILPMIGLGMLAGEGIEMVLLGTSAALATVSIGLGYRRHRSGRVVAVVAFGLGMLALGHLVETRGFEVLGVVAIVAGGLVVAGSHLLNRRLCRSCELIHVSTPAASGTAGRATSRSREGQSDPSADRRSASLTSIR